MKSLALEMISGRLPCAAGARFASPGPPLPFGGVPPKSLFAPAIALPASEARKNLRRDHSSIGRPSALGNIHHLTAANSPKNEFPRKREAHPNRVSSLRNNLVRIGVLISRDKDEYCLIVVDGRGSAGENHAPHHDSAGKRNQRIRPPDRTSRTACRCRPPDTRSACRRSVWPRGPQRRGQNHHSENDLRPDAADGRTHHRQQYRCRAASRGSSAIYRLP